MDQLQTRPRQPLSQSVTRNNPRNPARHDPHPYLTRPLAQPDIRREAEPPPSPRGSRGPRFIPQFTPLSRTGLPRTAPRHKNSQPGGQLVTKIPHGRPPPREKLDVHQSPEKSDTTLCSRIWR